MTMLANIKSKVILFAIAGTFLALTQPAAAQTAGVTKVYRGAVGRNHIQMSLTFNGNSISGKYSYDRVGQEIKVTGRLDGGKLELTEFGEKNKPSGKFSCKGRSTTQSIANATGQSLTAAANLLSRSTSNTLL